MAKLTQDTLIEALRGLRKVFPNLPDVTWRISQYALELHGEVGASNTLPTLQAYMDAIGGTIAPKHTYTYQPAGVPTVMQVFDLSTVWADVPVVITGSIPVAELAVAL